MPPRKSQSKIVSNKKPKLKLKLHEEHVDATVLILKHFGTLSTVFEPIQIYIYLINLKLTN